MRRGATEPLVLESPVSGPSALLLTSAPALDGVGGDPLQLGANLAYTSPVMGKPAWPSVLLMTSRTTDQRLNLHSTESLAAW